MVKLLGDEPAILEMTRDMIRLATKCAAEGRMGDVAKVQAFLREILAATDADELRVKANKPDGIIPPMWRQVVNSAMAGL